MPSSIIDGVETSHQLHFSLRFAYQIKLTVCVVISARTKQKKKSHKCVFKAIKHLMSLISYHNNFENIVEKAGFKTAQRFSPPLAPSQFLLKEAMGVTLHFRPGVGLACILIDCNTSLCIFHWIKKEITFFCMQNTFQSPKNILRNPLSKYTEMAPWVKVLATKAHNLNLIPRIHTVERKKNQPPQVILTGTV